MSTGSRKMRAGILALLPRSCMTLVKLYNLSETRGIRTAFTPLRAIVWIHYMRK